MNLKKSIEGFGINIRDFRRGAVQVACGVGILWLGLNAINDISDACAGNCGAAIGILVLIVGVAALAVPCALGGFWHYADHSSR
jgi:hypothetical protein